VLQNDEQSNIFDNREILKG
jgi:hypothetical protein